MDYREKKIEGNGHVAIHDWAPTDQSGKHKDSREIETDIEETRHSIDVLLDALEGRVHPRNVLDRFYNFFQRSENRQKALDTLSDVGRSFSNSFQKNPLPVMLLATGVVWTLWESQSGEGREGRISEKTDRYGKQAQEFKEGVGGKVAEGRERAKEKAEELRDRVLGKSQMTEGRASEYAEGAKNRIQGGAESANQFVRDNPLITGAIAMIGGLLVGALLPTTEKERETVGKSAENLAEKAEKKGGELAEKAENEVLKTGENLRENVQEKNAQLQRERDKGFGEQKNREAGRDYPTLPENI